MIFERKALVRDDFEEYLDFELTTTLFNMEALATYITVC